MGQLTLADMAVEDEAYKEFVGKFRPKKTTDDCYTPDNIYKAVADWVAQEYGVDRKMFIRPFWPGADYQEADYPDGCTVVDNPPFSILAQIKDFYIGHGIRFFLFCPTLTALSGIRAGVCIIAAGCKITYANGANVNTSFCTNLEPETILRSAPDLYQMVDRENKANEKAATKTLPKYEYPDNVITAAMAYHYSQHGIPYKLRPADCVRISELDAQKRVGKSIFGGGLLLSEKAAAEKAAAEKAAAEKAAAEKADATVWELSEREQEIVRSLGA